MTQQKEGMAHPPECATPSTLDPLKSKYIPPCKMLLEGLGISAADLKRDGAVLVSRAFLRALIGEFAGCGYFDEEWYAQQYPDVEGAQLAGEVASLLEHYKGSGYVEGRLPRELPFDGVWYRRQYADIKAAFGPFDTAEMRSHFLETGYFEGRAGTAETFSEAERWRSLIGS